MNTAALWQPNTEGIYLDLPAETYHKAPGVSNTTLKEMDPPANHKAAKPKKETPDMLLGTLIHQAVLEPQKPMNVVMKPVGMSFTTTDGKKWKAENEGQIILSPDDYWAVGGCAKSVLSHPKCAELLSEGNAEVSLFARHDATGLLRKGRVDWVPTGDCLADIKKVQKGCAARDVFARTLYTERHYVQAAYYLGLWNSLMPDDPRENFVFIVVESEAPYLVATYYVDQETLQLGREQYERDLATYAECKRTGVWPGYSTELLPIGVPGWAKRREFSEEA